uniref:AN1-type domain-containing protein n=1 Tax=Anas platyrhynchos TaxID=8839 RepID=A0A8B9QST2_ANAPL
MEFPELGEHCSWPPCQRLAGRGHPPAQSFVPPTPFSPRPQDVQVPVCPLCNTPVPVRRGEMPDVLVGEHIDRHCKADPAQRQRKIFTNKCLKPGCKQKEMMKVICEQCHKNYCLKHRHPLDHDCSGAGHSLSKHGECWGTPPAAALGGGTRPTLCLCPPSTQEEEDLALAQALSASEAEYQQLQRQVSRAHPGIPPRSSNPPGSAPGRGARALPVPLAGWRKTPVLPSSPVLLPLAGARLEALQLQHVVGGAPAEVVAPGAAVASHGDAVRTPWMLTGARHHLLSTNAHGQLSPACRGCSKPPGGAGLGRAQAHTGRSERRRTEGAEPAAGALAPLGRWGEGRAGLGGASSPPLAPAVLQGIPSGAAAPSGPAGRS